MQNVVSPMSGQKSWRRWLRFWMPVGLIDARRDAAAKRNLRQRGEFHPLGGQFILPTKSLGELFPDSGRTEVTLTPEQIPHRPDMLMPLPEQIILSSVCRQSHPRRIFELGTYLGTSTLVMALNTPPEVELFTLDLPPADPAGQSPTAGPQPSTTATGSAFVGRAAAGKIRQLYGDSRRFDFTPYHGTVDLVLVDADHAYEGVKADTATAFKLLRPGGIIVWDDYRWEPQYPECSGVTRCLNELAGSKSIHQIAGTRLAIYLDTPGEKSATPLPSE